MKNLMIAFLLFPLILQAQSIRSNLDYINSQFDQYNKYETSFDVNESSKKLLFEDRFINASANFSEVEVKAQGNNVGVYCLDGSKCIKSEDKDDGSVEYYSEYTMGLRFNDKIIPHIDIVMDKFAEVKTAVMSKSSGNGGNKENIRKRVIELTQDLEGIYRNSSDYNSKWSINFRTKELSRQSSLCQVTYPLEKISAIEYFKGGLSDRHGYVIKSRTKVINEDCESFNNNVDASYDYFDNYSAAEQAVSYLKEIHSLMTGSSLSGSSNTNTSPSGTVDYTRRIKDKLEYINNQFSRYNDYETSFEMDTEAQVFVQKNEFGRIRGKLDEVEMRYERDNEWVGIFCKDGSKCLRQRKKDGEGFNTYESYTMSLKDGGSTISHINSVMDAFDDLFTMSKAMKPNIYRGPNAYTINRKLDYINGQFDKFNAYGTSFDIDYSNQKFIFRNEFGISTANLRDVEIRAVRSNGWVGVYCLNSSSECITQESTSGGNNYYSDYTMSLKDDGEMISDVDEFLRACREVIRLAKR